jgi:hypothetical protein
MTARDRTVVAVVAALAILAGFWFLAVSPRRADVAQLRDQVSTARDAASAAEQRASAGLAAQRTYARGLADVARLGKAVPQVDDQASLLYQLQDAAGRSRVNITAVTPAGATPPPGSPGAAPAATTAPAIAPAGVQPVDISLAFEGTYRELQRFLARIHGFTSIGGRHIAVRGRLVSVRSVDLKTTQSDSAPISASIAAEVFVALPAAPAPDGSAPAAGTGAPTAASSVPPTTPAMIGAGG